jgi:hypothetical protein
MEANMKNAEITVDGITVQLTQPAYISDSGDTYQANAEDVEGNLYHVYWDVVDSETGDQSAACNWETPSKIITR